MQLTSRTIRCCSTYDNHKSEFEVRVHDIFISCRGFLKYPCRGFDKNHAGSHPDICWSTAQGQAFESILSSLFHQFGHIENQAEEVSILFHCKHRSRAVAELAAKMFQSLKYSATVHQLTDHWCSCKECQKGGVNVIRKIVQKIVQVSNSLRFQTLHSNSLRDGIDLSSGFHVAR